MARINIEDVDMFLDPSLPMPASTRALLDDAEGAPDAAPSGRLSIGRLSTDWMLQRARMDEVDAVNSSHDDVVRDQSCDTAPP